MHLVNRMEPIPRRGEDGGRRNGANRAGGDDETTVLTRFVIPKGDNMESGTRVFLKAHPTVALHYVAPHPKLEGMTVVYMPSTEQFLSFFTEELRLAPLTDEHVIEQALDDFWAIVSNEEMFAYSEAVAAAVQAAIEAVRHE